MERSTDEVVAELVETTRELIRREVATAHAEAVRQVKRELRAAAMGGAALGAAAVMGLLLVTAGVAAWALLLPVWAAALVMAGIVLVGALVLAYAAWSRRVKHLLPETREQLAAAAQGLHEARTH